jgi:hypothetical protein
MSVIKSFADFIVDWQKVLAAYAANAKILTGAAFLRDELEKALERAIELKGVQEVQKAAKQATTKEIREVKRVASEAARRIRSHAKSMLGSRSEHLAAFQTPPLRDRQVRRGQPDEESPTQPAAPENPEPAPEIAKPSEPSAAPVDSPKGD